MKAILNTAMTVIWSILIFSSCTTPEEKDYQISSVNFADVDLTDNFWSEKIDRNLKITMPYVLDELKSRNSLGGSGISKVLEGISYYLMVDRNPELEALADTLISYIKTTQQPDGYIGRRRSVPDGTAMSDSLLWLGTDDFGETGGSPMLYGFGHLYEAAVAYYQATGKTSLLEVAEKNAGLLLSVFGPGKLESYPFHPEIELALVKLYRATGKKEYLELSKFFLDSRGPNGTEYSQSHLKITDQREATGHAVRALYLYSGITDIVALTGDKKYETALNAIWQSVVDSKFYVTGGLGGYSDHEAFGEQFDLPNETAYNETCASIAWILWNYRMFLLYGKSEYIDVLETTLYNSLLSGISATGDRFFYPNPLASSGQYQRASWYGVSCCPTNVVRFLPQVPGFIYAIKGNDLYVNLFISSESELTLNNGNVSVSQVSDLPWQGKVKLEVNPETTIDFKIRIRIPGWADNRPVPSDLYSYNAGEDSSIQIAVNGKPVEYKTENGYAVLNRTWSAGDIVSLELPMDVKKIISANSVEADKGKFAIQRGPFIYCLEGPDNINCNVNNVLIQKDAEFAISSVETLEKESIQLITQGVSYEEQVNGKKTQKISREVKAIPYYLWANRGPAEMVVWIPYDETAVIPRTYPVPSIASKSRILSSYDTTTLKGINDRFIIPYNQNIPISNYYRWPMDDTIQWVQYIFESAETVSSVQVYWYDNEPSTMTTWYNGIPWTCCRVPESWELFYMDEKNNWLPVKTSDEYGVGKYTYNKVTFEPVRTNSLKMIVKRHGTCASGLQEWIVN